MMRMFFSLDDHFFFVHTFEHISTICFSDVAYLSGWLFSASVLWWEWLVHFFVLFVHFQIHKKVNVVEVFSSKLHRYSHYSPKWMVSFDVSTSDPEAEDSNDGDGTSDESKETI